MHLALVAVASLAGSAPARGQDLASFEKRVSRKVLPNGLTALVCVRPEAPVFSFFTHVDAGSDREGPGITGLAHMFEHMAFKGTDTIGTRDYAAEKVALEGVEKAYAAYDIERRRPLGADPAKLAELEKAWRAAMADADHYVVRNELGEIIDRSGGVGLNASTGSDATTYYYSLPANRLELWAYLESERFLKPVMREFYNERDVVMEERRMRVDSHPIGRALEQFLAAAFAAHPYGQPGIGWPSDLRSFSATDAQAFYERYYVPASMVVAVVGVLFVVRGTTQTIAMAVFDGGSRKAMESAASIDPGSYRIRMLLGRAWARAGRCGALPAYRGFDGRRTPFATAVVGFASCRSNSCLTAWVHAS
jgi:predicted Zn-dependent peptidase